MKPENYFIIKDLMERRECLEGKLQRLEDPAIDIKIHQVYGTSSWGIMVSPKMVKAIVRDSKALIEAEMTAIDKELEKL